MQISHVDKDAFPKEKILNPPPNFTSLPELEYIQIKRKIFFNTSVFKKNMHFTLV